MRRLFSLSCAALAAALLGGCAARPDTEKAAALLAALQNTAALTNYAVISHTDMQVGNAGASDGLTITQRFWRSGADAMQKMSACDAAGQALFENGSAVVGDVYYWYDGAAWAPDTTGMAAASNLNWVPKVTWPQDTRDFTLEEQDGAYTVTFRQSAFPDLVQAQADALQAEADAPREQGFAEAADARQAEADSARQAKYHALRYTIEVADGRAVACTTYSEVEQPAVQGLDSVGIAADELVTSTITYTWRLTGSDPQAIAAVLAEVTAGSE